MTLSKIQALCKEWQAILGLSDWATKCKLCRPGEMGELVGSCTINLDDRQAIIKLLRPSDYEPDDWPLPYDIEEVLVHELTHIHLEPLKIPKALEVDMEQAINAISRALIRARRMRPRPLTWEPDPGAMCREWQGLLGLSDWALAFGVASRQELGHKWGTCQVSQIDRQAIIQVMEPRGYNPGNWPRPFKVEEVVVHELLHILTDAIWRPSKLRQGEQALNALSAALVRVRQMAPPPAPK